MENFIFCSVAIASTLSKLHCECNAIMLIGEFNLTVANNYLGIFITTFHMENLIKSKSSSLKAQDVKISS